MGISSAITNFLLTESPESQSGNGNKYVQFIGMEKKKRKRRKKQPEQILDSGQDKIAVSGKRR